MQVAENSIYYLEIVTPEVEKLCRLYTDSQGWRFESAKPELGNARLAKLPEGSLCGIRAPMHEAEKPVVRTYLRVTDLEKSVQRAAQAGANILLENMNLAGYGVIAIYEMGGVEQGLWQVD